MLEELKREVYQALLELPKNDLIKGTSGNVSGREDDYVVIKPSGVKYEELSPLDLVVVDMKGNLVEGNLKPSVDTGAHLHIYRKLEDMGGIVHTHSTYATVFAALGRPIPVYLTELADFFGGPIPVSNYIPPGVEAIGQEFAKKASKGLARGILMRNHGVFTAGSTPSDALKAAITVEHCAQISYLAEIAGSPEELSSGEAEKLHRKYVKEYGQ